jgi:hypothetical protein
MKTSSVRPAVVDLVQAVVIPAALAVATFLAATPWLHVFSVPGMPGLLVVASIAAVAIPTLAIRVWRQPPVVTYAASGAGLVVFLFAAVGLHPDDLWHGLTTGPNRMLTETLPLSGSRALLTAPLLLTWLCGTASAELVGRSRRPNSGLAAVGLAIPVVCFVVAYAVSASRPGQDEIAAPLLLIILVAVAVLRHVTGIATAPQALVGSRVEAERRPPLWRAALAGGAIAAVIAVVLAVAVPAAPRMSRRPVSLNRAAPLTTAMVSDPLDAMANLRDGAPHSPRTVLRVRTSAPSSGYLATVILDGYDGGLWGFTSTFQPTGERIPTPSGSAGGAAGAVGLVSVRQQDALVAALPVPFLPALDRPVAVRGLEVGADAATGMLLPSHPTAGPLSYSVRSQAPVATLATVSSADGIGAVAGGTLPGAGLVSRADLALPPNTTADLGTALRFLAEITGRRPAPTVAFLQAVMASLHTREKRVDPSLAPLPASTPPTSAPKEGLKKGKAKQPAAVAVRPTTRPTSSGGTSLSVVINAVVNKGAATPEQFGTLYAMVARYLGVPARLVTGFRLGAASNTGAVPAGSYQVTNRQAWTWVEIPVAGMGWVVADPTPTAVTGPTAEPLTPFQAAANSLQPPQANAVPRNQTGGTHAAAKPAAVHIPDRDTLPWWGTLLAVLGGVVVILAMLGPGLAGVRRALRRRARHRSDPSELAVGAWLELLDSLEQAGMSTGPGDTSVEVANDAGRHFGPDVTGPVQEVGAVAEQAVFAVTGSPDADAAQRAWETQHDVRSAVFRGLDRRQRARALLTVGSAPRQPAGGSGSRSAQASERPPSRT